MERASPEMFLADNCFVPACGPSSVDLSDNPDLGASLFQVLGVTGLQRLSSCANTHEGVLLNCIVFRISVYRRRLLTELAGDNLDGLAAAALMDVGDGPPREAWSHASLRSITVRYSRQGHSDCRSAHVSAPLSEDHLQAHNVGLRGSTNVAARGATAPHIPLLVHWLRPLVVP